MNVKRCSFLEQIRDVWKVCFAVGVIVVVSLGAYKALPIHGLANGAVAGCVAGVAVHWLKFAKSAIVVNNDVIWRSKCWLEWHGYKKISDNVFIPKVHRLLRFDSQNVTYEKIDDFNTRILCPYAILRKMEEQAL